MRRDDMMTSIGDEKNLLAFVQAAAAGFASHPEWWTWSDDDRFPNLLAMRWGLGNDCARVLRLDPDFQPRNYQQAIPRTPEGRGDG